VELDSLKRSKCLFFSIYLKLKLGKTLSKTKARHLKKTEKQAKASAAKLDIFLWFLVLLLIFFGLGTTYYYSALARPLKISFWIVLLIVVGGIAVKTAKGAAIFDFAKKAKTELRKVAWPTRQETLQATAIVGLIVVVMSLMLWLIDSGLVYIAGLATGQRG
jgi:preprotein translocase subunit SecE